MAEPKPMIAGAELLHTIGNAQQGAGLFGILQHFLVHGFRFFRLAVDVHLDLVELMSAFDAAHVASRAHLLAAEAGRVGGVQLRQ